MNNGALYYPYFYVRNRAWLKLSALYWPHIYRFVPSGYVMKDPEDIKRLESSGLLVSVDPSSSVRIVSDEFDEFLSREPNSTMERWRQQLSHEDRLDSHELTGMADEAGLVAASTFVVPKVNEAFSFKRLPETSFIHASQLSPELITRLRAEDLARGPYMEDFIAHMLPSEYSGEITKVIEAVVWRAREGNFAQIAHEAPFRPEMAGGLPASDNWMLMASRLVTEYTTRLSEHFAARNSLQLVTDQETAYASLSLGQDASEQQTPRDSTTTVKSVVGMLAIEHVIPLGELSVGTIIEIRRRHGEDFVAYRKLVDQVGDELSTQLSVTDPGVLQILLEDTVSSRLLAPMKKLRHELKMSGVDSTTAAITVKAELPTLLTIAGGAELTGHPMIAGSSAAALAIFAIGRNLVQHRRELRSANSAANYLLRVSHSQSPRSYLRALVDRLGK